MSRSIYKKWSPLDIVYLDEERPPQKLWSHTTIFSLEKLCFSHFLGHENLIWGEIINCTIYVGYFDEDWPPWKFWSHTTILLIGPTTFLDISENWVGPHEKMILWLRNFGHDLSSSYYMIYVLRSQIRPNLTKKVKNLIRKMSGAPWKNCPMTPKLWPWPILINWY